MICSSFFLVLAAIAATAAGDSFDSWQLRLLDGSNEAVCLDGSPPGYYIERGAPNAGWMVHWQGGGWCMNPDDCANRAKSPLGSSSSYAADKDDVLGAYDGGAHGLFSNSSTVNPDFHNFTKVYVRYCDGASFSGDTVAQHKSAPGGSLHFRGRRVLDAVLDDLVQQGLTKGTTLLVNGCSAGGLAVWLHLDYIATRLKEVKVLGTPSESRARNLRGPHAQLAVQETDTSRHRCRHPRVRLLHGPAQR
jgi:hypothetical protein